MTSAVLDAACAYLDRGWTPVPLQAARLGDSKTGKRPIGKAWQAARPTREELPYLLRGGRNVGINLGAPSGGLVDVDLDCDEAVELACEFLPQTRMRHGRGGRLTHWWYRCADDDGHRHDHKGQAYDANGVRTFTPKGRPKTATLVELRSGTVAKGHQTAAPPSTHYTGARLEWAEPGPPPPEELPHAELLAAVKALALAVAMLRSGATREDAVAFARAPRWESCPDEVLRPARKWGLAPKAAKSTAAARGARSDVQGTHGTIAAPLTEAVLAACTVGRALLLLGCEGLDEEGQTRCPVHGGENPTSFKASWHAHLWYCHSCKATGDAIHLVSAVRGEGRLAAREWLAEAVGIDWREILAQQRDVEELPAPARSRAGVGGPDRLGRRGNRARCEATLRLRRRSYAVLDARIAGEGKSTGAGEVIARVYGEFEG